MTSWKMFKALVNKCPTSKQHGFFDTVYILKRTTVTCEEESSISIFLREDKPGVFEVVRDNRDPFFIGFSGWDNEVEDLSDRLDLSTRVRWNDVELTPNYFYSPNIKRLMEALAHVKIRTWRPGDI